MRLLCSLFHRSVLIRECQNDHENFSNLALFTLAVISFFREKDKKMWGEVGLFLYYIYINAFDYTVKKSFKNAILWANGVPEIFCEINIFPVKLNGFPLFSL